MFFFDQSMQGADVFSHRFNNNYDDSPIADVIHEFKAKGPEMTQRERSLDRLKSVLTSQTVAKSLSKVRDVLANREFDYTEPDPQEKSRALIAHFGRMGCDGYLLSSLRDTVLSKLDRPCVTTADEMARAFVQHVLMSPNRPFEDAYRNFCIAVASETTLRVSDPFPTITNFDGGVEWSKLINSFLLDYGEDFQAYISGMLPIGEEPLTEFSLEEDTNMIYVSLRGRFSAGAFQKTISEFKDVEMFHPQWHKTFRD